MRVVLIALLSALSSSVYCQKGFKIGIEVDPSWKGNIHHSTTTGVWTAENGYGFSLGVPIKYGWNETNSLNTGLLYEFTSFDQLFKNVLTASLRISALQLPVMFNFKLRSTWFWSTGAGLNYNFINRGYSYGYYVNINNTVRQLQPWVGLGIGDQIARDFGLFELGAQARFQFLQLWTKDYAKTQGASSRILAFDVILRYYL